MIDTLIGFLIEHVIKADGQINSVYLNCILKTAFYIDQTQATPFLVYDIKKSPTGTYKNEGISLKKNNPRPCQSRIAGLES